MLPPGVNCRKGAEVRANPTVAISRLPSSSAQRVSFRQQPIYRLAELLADCQKDSCASFFVSAFQ